jgi:hypothetical protein
MMDSSMLCYKRALKFVGLLIWLSGLVTLNVYADGISVNKAETRLTEEGYQLKADFDINLNYTAQQALSHGVTLYFVSEFTLTRSRWYWLDEQIAVNEQVTKLYYNVLTRQYRISRGPLFQSFPTLEDALGVLQRQNSAPIARELLEKSGKYLAGARLRLDVEQLPKLLQVNAWTGRDWDLDSKWYRWEVRPAEISSRQQNMSEDAR